MLRRHHESPANLNKMFYKYGNHICLIMSDFSVYVDSRGGNTRKVADAIAEELGVTAGDVTVPVLGDARILFLGSGTYGSRPGDAMTKFIELGDFTGRKVAIFGTSASPAGSEKMIAVMSDDLNRKGATILGRWHCRGKFLIMNRGHPDREDMENAKKFAREIVRSA
ncbi:MAG: flavodoxin [Methanoregula sp. PtaU1.Bin051]|nr:MAG: flavodoxin [Methanoregula sp. PtaU1.Bin051]